MENEETKNEQVQQPSPVGITGGDTKAEEKPLQIPPLNVENNLGTTPLIDSPQTDTMEVHKHPHHVTHKKKWPEYFLEFFMIFVAVFLGFLAENLREEVVERKKERQYVSSLFQELKDDTLRIHFHIRTRSLKAEMMDSLADLLVSARDSAAQSEVNYLARFVTRSFPFISENGTLQQLKNSDGLRLIRKEGVADSILRYDGAFRYIQYVDETEMFPIENSFREIAGEVFDSKAFKFKYTDLPRRTVNPTPLVTNDPAVINKVALQVRQEAGVLERSVQNLQGLDRHANRLMELLRSKYDL